MLSAGFLLISIGLSLTADAEEASRHSTTNDLLNERFPVNPEHMEQQWGVNCRHALLRAQNVKQSPVSAQDKAALQRELELCSYIYNAPERRFYSPCPDYLAWKDWLEHPVKIKSETTGIECINEK